MSFITFLRHRLRVGGMLLAFAALSLLSIVAPWQSSASADTLVTQTPVPTDTQPVDWNTFPVTATMTDTMQLALNAYLDATSGEHLVPPAFPVELASARSLAFLPYVANGSTTIASPTPRPTAIASPTPRPTTPEPTKNGADVAVTLWPAPSIRAARNGTVAYELRVTNYDKGSADKIRVTLPFKAQQLTLVNAVVDTRKGDWVSEATSTSVTVTFGPIDAATTRVGTLIFRVNTTLANDTVLDMRASYNWNDDRGDHGDYLSNWAPVLVGGGNDSAPWVWLKLDPISGAANTERVVISNRYAPGEGVVTWLNTPSGVRAFDARATADGLGNVSLRFTSAGLARGTYQLVVYGSRSALTGVATFTVN